jgi:nitroimidazol reductase NimA-like FMN-containing flavoprotein (pyridoxamine 5'-phosphate oxidase superfamily)
MASRRESIEFTQAEVREYAASEKTLIIVSNGKDGFPHPMPMWFYADDEGCFYCTTFSKSQKVRNFQRDPRATLMIESGEEYAALKGLVIYARTEILDSPEDVVDTLVKINTRGADPDPEQLEKLTQAVSKTAEKRVALKFIPERYVSWDHSKLGGKY